MLVDRIDVRQSTLLDPPVASFDRKAPAAVQLKLLRAGSELTGITGLKQGADYTVSGSTVTLSPAYLAGLPVGTTQLDFGFRGDRLDDVHATTVNGAAVSYTFTGTGVDWITATGPDQGLADIYVDGKLVRRIDTRSAVRATQQTVAGIAGLTNRQHTVKVVKVSGEVMRTDVLRYTVR